MKFIKLYKILQKVKIVYIILSLLVVGVVCMVSTMYQEKIKDPDLDDYHMGIPSTGKYEWRSHNLLISTIGIACLILGAILTIGLLWMHRRKISAEKSLDDSQEAEAEERTS